MLTQNEQSCRVQHQRYKGADRLHLDLKVSRNVASQAEGHLHPCVGGVQYWCTRYVDELKNHILSVRIFRENHTCENAIAERVKGILKDELYFNQCFFDHEKAKVATN